MENKEELIPQYELAIEDDSIKQNINIDRISKYKDMFDKHKNENGFINQEDMNAILNEFGRKTNVEETNEFIKKSK